MLMGIPDLELLQTMVFMKYIHSSLSSKIGMDFLLVLFIQFLMQDSDLLLASSPMVLIEDFGLVYVFC